MKLPTDVLFISRKKNRVYTTYVSPLLICIMAALCCVFVLTIALMVCNGSNLYQKIDLTWSELEHTMLVNKLEFLKNELASIDRNFEGHVAQDNRERTFWQLERIHPDVWSMGIGGFAEVKHMAIADRTRNLLSDIYQSLDVVKGKSYLRKVSLHEIEQRIAHSVSLWSHIPSIHPVPGAELGSGFGYRVDPIDRSVRMHRGIDIGASRGMPILATADGVVMSADWSGGYGLAVEIDHGFGFRTRYCHCEKVLVNPGDFVRRGQTVAIVGSTGRAVAYHLHYEVIVSNTKVNPHHYIDQSHVVVD